MTKSGEAAIPASTKVHRQSKPLPLILYLNPTPVAHHPPY
jgi:hypothetical protein